MNTHIRFYPNKGSIWIDFKLPNGKRKRMSTGCTEQTAAEAVAPDLVAQVSTDSPAIRTLRVTRERTSMGVTLQQAFNIAMRERNGWIEAKDTVGLDATLKTLGVPLSTDCGEMTYDKVIALREMWMNEPGKREGTKLSNSTINRRLSMLSVLLDTVKCPPHGVKHLSVEGNRRKRRVRDTEIDAVQAWLHQNHKREGAIAMSDLIVVAGQTSARLSELLNLKWPDVYFSEKQVIYRDTKNGTHRAGILNDVALAVLGRRATLTHIKTPFGDLSARQAKFLWTCAREAIGLGDDPEFVFHVATRHESLSKLGEAGANAFQLKAFSGHKSIAAADRYVKPSLESLRGLGDVLAKATLRDAPVTGKDE